MRRIVLYLTARSDYGGAYQFWLAMLKALSQLNRTRYELNVYSSHAGWQPIAKNLQIECKVINNNINSAQRICNGIMARILPPALFKKYNHLWHPVARPLKKNGANQADIWIAQTSEIGGRLLGLPTVIPVFDLMHRFYPDLPEIVGEYQNREKLYHKECYQAAMILVDSQMGLDHMVQCYGDIIPDLAAKIRILPFIPPDYIYAGIEKEVSRERIFEKYFFYPAQFWAHKNHERLIRSVSLLREKGISVNLVLSGSEQVNRAQMEALITELRLDNQIKILGYVTNEEMVYLYRNARALIMPSLFGPTNIPPLEAFELGCPVAISNLFGMPEQVGDAALLFDPFSTEEMAKCMEVLWTDDAECRKLVQKGKDKASRWGQEQFTEIALKYMDEFYA